jgi:hypothetical protein
MKKKDVLLIACVIAVAGILAFFNFIRSSAWSYNMLMADVFVDGKLYKSIPISEKASSLIIVTDYGKNTIKIHDEGFEMIDADCPDKVCKLFGFKSNPGDMIVCLPHHLYIEIKGAID